MPDLLFFFFLPQGREPTRLFNLVEFMICDKDGGGTMSEDECMEILYHRFGKEVRYSISHNIQFTHIQYSLIRIPDLAPCSDKLIKCLEQLIQPKTSRHQIFAKFLWCRSTRSRLTKCARPQGALGTPLGGLPSARVLGQKCWWGHR